MKSISSLPRPIIRAALIGFIMGILWFVVVRVALFNPEGTHYHANFALYINGEQDPFDSFTFFEEVQQCSADEISPRSRVHMHDDVSSVIHIHDEGVTWAHFFANLNYGLGNDYVKTDAGIFEDNQDAELTFILNGTVTPLLSNTIIGDEDVLLISYGDESQETLMERFSAIPDTAAAYNEQPDPSACSGTDSYSLTDRIKSVLGIN